MRVTTGSARGRALQVPKTDLRPTADKIKQAIFSMLEAEALKRGFESVEDEATGEVRFAAAQAWPRVADLYAGSGALGIEALSRGAEHAELVERDRSSCQMIRANLESTRLADRARVSCLPVESWAASAGPFDLILLDPPYTNAAEGTRVLETLLERGVCLAESVIVWEQARTREPLLVPVGLQVFRQRDHGRTTIALLQTARPPQHDAYDPSQ